MSYGFLASVAIFAVLFCIALFVALALARSNNCPECEKRQAEQWTDFLKEDCKCPACGKLHSRKDAV